MFPGLSQDVDWLQVAIDTQAEFDRWFWSDESCGYFNTPKDQGLTCWCENGHIKIMLPLRRMESPLQTSFA
jgi:hypothetical protein